MMVYHRLIFSYIPKLIVSLCTKLVSKLVRLYLPGKGHADLSYTTGMFLWVLRVWRLRSSYTNRGSANALVYLPNRHSYTVLYKLYDFFFLFVVDTLDLIKLLINALVSFYIWSVTLKKVIASLIHQKYPLLSLLIGKVHGH